MYTSHAKPYAGLAEQRLGESVHVLLKDFETKVHKELTAVTNQGFGEVMTIRNMDLSPEVPVNCFMVGVVTHHYNLNEGYQVDTYDVDSIKAGVKDLTTAFIKYADL